MTVPGKPLVVKELDAKHLTLGELTLFTDPGSLAPGLVTSTFIKFCEKYTNWTLSEILDMEIIEMQEVGQMIFAKVEESAVPKANGTRSNNGRGKRKKLSPPGSS